MTLLAGWENFYLIVGSSAAALLLLFTGIHNAWDAVTYHIYVGRREHHGDEPRR